MHAFQTQLKRQITYRSDMQFIYLVTFDFVSANVIWAHQMITQSVRLNDADNNSNYL